MNITDTRLNLPLFFLSRLQFKRKNLNEIRKLIDVKRENYGYCIPADKKTKDLIAPVIARYLKGCKFKRRPSRKMPGVEDRPWVLAPNRYDTHRVPYERYKGSIATIWDKAEGRFPRRNKLAKDKEPPPKFYDLPRETSRLKRRCAKPRGKFVTDARARRPTVRSMINNLVTCYRNPKDPSPACYAIFNHCISYNMAEAIEPEIWNPHNFYRHSAVPVTETSIYVKDHFISPGPGRYELFIKGVCPCPRNLPNSMAIQMWIDIQKRRKFRRLRYIKFDGRRYCLPEWRHVIGQGHSRLFVKPKEKIKKTNIKDYKVTDKLYPDARYIHMINSPLRRALSIRAQALVWRPPRISFNCMARRVHRRRLKVNDKIGFLSGAPRFKDDKVPLPLTADDIAALRVRLPPELQLKSLPVTNIPLSQITNKLKDIPFHMLSTYKPKIRKPDYKFLPLPGTKLLMPTRKSCASNVVADCNIKMRLGATLNVEDFFQAEYKVVKPPPPPPEVEPTNDDLMNEELMNEDDLN